MERKKKKLIYNVVVSLLLIAGLVWVCSHFVHLGSVAYTDNAQVKQLIVPVNSRVQGFIKKIYFDEYQEVRKGDTLALIEDSEFRFRLAQAEAEARAIQMKLEAEAEGKKKSLLAEAEGFEAMVRAAESNPAIAIQYKMVDQWKEIAGEQVKAFEHMNLGNITVFDGGNGGTSNFLNTLVKTVAPSLGVLDKLPIGETVKGIIHPEGKEDKQETQKDEPKKDDKKK